MPATQKKCERCKRKFWACRKDAKWCSEKCRSAERAETARFIVHPIPRSGVIGVTYHRIIKRWIAKYNNNYLGSSKNVEEAIAIRRKAEEGRTMKISLCFLCKYKNESSTAICSKPNCPLMIEKSPFTYLFSDGIKSKIEEHSDEISNTARRQT